MVAATAVALGAWTMEAKSVGCQVTVSLRMAARRSLWGVGRSHTGGACGTVVTKDTRSLDALWAAIGVPSGTSTGTCQVSVLFIVVSVELTVSILGWQ